ncbi:processed acidic surface protein [Bacillus sp. JCM 19041]|uniref:processed acidic surface protein n=1 Tax=Bacillus sp. JCM 19041 TaxID=1460637 RepID=UPI0006CF7743
MKKSFVLMLLTLVFILSNPLTSLAHGFDDAEFDAYLEEVGVSEKDLAEHLMYWWDGTTFYQFENVDELADFLGPRLTDESINEILDELSADYGYDREELDFILDEWIGMPYSDFLFYNTFYVIVDVILTIIEEDWGPYFPDFEGFLKEFSLSYEEEWALYEHFWYISETNPQLSNELEDLKQRSYAFEGFESIRELSAADVAELFSIGEKAIDVLDLHPKYYLDRVGEDKKPIDYKTLISGEAIKGYDLLIELYDADGYFLADFYITAEMFNSHFVKKVVEDVTEIGKVITEKPKKPAPETLLPNKDKVETPAHKDTNKTESNTAAERDANGKVTKTVAGAKMPNTATNYPLYILLGFGLMVSGIILSRRVLREKKVA